MQYGWALEFPNSNVCSTIWPGNFLITKNNLFIDLPISNSHGPSMVTVLLNKKNIYPAPSYWGPHKKFWSCSGGHKSTIFLNAKKLRMQKVFQSNENVASSSFKDLPEKQMKIKPQVKIFFLKWDSLTDLRTKWTIEELPLLKEPNLLVKPLRYYQYICKQQQQQLYAFVNNNSMHL